MEDREVWGLGGREVSGFVGGRLWGLVMLGLVVMDIRGGGYSGGSRVFGNGGWEMEVMGGRGRWHIGV